jgi:hypothetical protein
MHVILLRQFSQRLLALDGRQRHFGLESRGMRPACAFLSGDMRNPSTDDGENPATPG